MNTLVQQNKAHFHIRLDTQKIKGKIKHDSLFWADFEEVYIPKVDILTVREKM